MLEIETIRKADRTLISLGGFFILIYMLTWTDFSLGDEVGIIEFVAVYFVSTLFVLGLSVLPFLIFYAISASISKKGRPPKYSRISLLITIFVVPISCWLYYAAGKDIEGSTSSTAVVIFAVLPFYIGIFGSLLYGAVYFAARKGT